MVAVVWVRDPREQALRSFGFANRLEPVLDQGSVRPEDSVLVLTSLDRDDALEALCREAFASNPPRMGTSASALELQAMCRHVFAASRHLVVMGAGEIAEIVDSDPGLRARMPSVLGLRELEALIDPGVRARSSLDVEHAQELARVFWPTADAHNALRIGRLSQDLARARWWMPEDNIKVRYLRRYLN